MAISVFLFACSDDEDNDTNDDTMMNIVELAQFLPKYGKGPLVRNNVVNRQDQHVVIIGQLK